MQEYKSFPHVIHVHIDTCAYASVSRLKPNAITTHEQANVFLLLMLFVVATITVPLNNR